MSHRPFVPERTSHRPARFAHLVRSYLVELVPGKLKDPRLEGLIFLTLTSVEVTPDLRNATIRFSLTEQDEHRAKDVTEALNHAAGFLRRELMKRLETKITPHLVFKYDHGFSDAAEIDSLLKTLK